jgi:hypothetical protein
MRAVVRKTGKRTKMNGKRNSSGVGKATDLPPMQGLVVVNGKLEAGSMEDGSKGLEEVAGEGQGVEQDGTLGVVVAGTTGVWGTRLEVVLVVDGITHRLPR